MVHQQPGAVRDTEQDDNTGAEEDQLGAALLLRGRGRRGAARGGTGRRGRGTAGPGRTGAHRVVRETGRQVGPPTAGAARERGRGRERRAVLRRDDGDAAGERVTGDVAAPAGRGRGRRLGRQHRRVVGHTPGHATGGAGTLALRARGTPGARHVEAARPVEVRRQGRRAGDARGRSGGAGCTHAEVGRGTRAAGRAGAGRVLLARALGTVREVRQVGAGRGGRGGLGAVGATGRAGADDRGVRGGFARGEPVAAALLPGRLLGSRFRPRRTGSCLGGRCGVGRVRRTARRGRGGARDAARALGFGGVGFTHGRTHDDGRDGTRARDVDPDARRQCRLGPRLFGPRRFRRLRGPLRGVLRRVQRRILAGSVRRRPRGVRGSSTPLGPGGRTVSFTTQSRFSRLAPPPVLPPCRRPGDGSAREPLYWPPPADTAPPGQTAARPPDGQGALRDRTWHITCQVGRCRRPFAATATWWHRSQRRPSRPA